VLFTLFKERPGGDRQKLPYGALRFRDLVHTPAQPVARPPLPDEPAVLQYTGGTTGVPKAAVLTHRALLANAFQTRAWFQKAEVGRENILALMPFFHVYGLTVALHMGVVLAAKLTLVPQFEPKDMLKTITKECPTLLPGAPRVYVALTDANRRGVKGDLSSIRACLSGSAPLPREVADAFEQLSGGVVVEGYGLTEASPVTHANPLFGERRIGTVGLPIPDVECRICDLDDPSRVLGYGVVGEVCVRGPNLMSGYWGRLDESAKARVQRPRSLDVSREVRVMPTRMEQGGSGSTSEAMNMQTADVAPSERNSLIAVSSSTPRAVLLAGVGSLFFVVGA